MTELEIRLVAWLLALLSLIAVTAWSVHTLDAHHYERLAAADKLSQDTVLQAQQAKNMANLQAQQAATIAAETKYEALKASDDALGQRFADSVRAYQGLRGEFVSATSAAAALTHGAAQEPCSDPELARLSGAAVQAALDDAATLISLQTWARALSGQ